MVVSALANSFIFAELANLMSELTSRVTELNETIDNMYSIMTDFKIDQYTKKNVRMFLLKSNNVMLQQQTFIEFTD